MAIPSESEMMTKTCTKCDREQAYDQFSVRTANGWRDADGILRASWCKVCVRAQAAAWKQANQTPEHVARWAANVKARKQRIKDAVFAAYGGYRCNCCGETERRFLTIDHIHNDGAAWRKATLGSRLATGARTYRWLMTHGFPKGHQVLCMNCNFGKRMNGGICPHLETRNDYSLVEVGPSGPKRTASA